MNKTSDIKKILMSELDSLIKGKTDVKRAKAVANLSAQAIYATRVELENKRLEIDIAKNPDIKDWANVRAETISVPSLKSE